MIDAFFSPQRCISFESKLKKKTMLLKAKFTEITRVTYRVIENNQKVVAAITLITSYLSVLFYVIDNQA